MKNKLSSLSSSLLLLLASAVPAVILSGNAGVAATLNSTAYEDSVNQDSSVNFSPNLDEKLTVLFPDGESSNTLVSRAFVRENGPSFVRKIRPFVRENGPSFVRHTSNLQKVDEAAIALNSRPSAMETFRSLNANG